MKYDSLALSLGEIRFKIIFIRQMLFVHAVRCCGSNFLNDKLELWF